VSGRALRCRITAREASVLYGRWRITAREASVL
jgi:hypothetical protein